MTRASYSWSYPHNWTHSVSFLRGSALIRMGVMETLQFFLNSRVFVLSTCIFL